MLVLISQENIVRSVEDVIITNFQDMFLAEIGSCCGYDRLALDRSYICSCISVTKTTYSFIVFNVTYKPFQETPGFNPRKLILLVYVAFPEVTCKGKIIWPFQVRVHDGILSVCGIMFIATHRTW